MGQPDSGSLGGQPEAMEAQKHGKSFLRSLEVLDVGKAGTISQSKAEEALNKYMRFFQESDQKLQEALVQLVVESGQLYLAGMHLLEQRAFFLKASGWGKKLRRGDVPKELAARHREQREVGRRSCEALSCQVQDDGCQEQWQTQEHPRCGNDRWQQRGK